MASKLIISLRDYGTPGEISACAFEGATLTAANFDAQAALMAALSGAVTGITLGSTKKVVRVSNTIESAGALPASQFAQRESKWLVLYHDNNTGDKQRCEIPTADLTLLDPTAQDKADMSAADIVTFVGAFEDYVLSAAGNAVTVDEIRYVGRKT